MPSVLIGNPLASGPQILISGCFWSGRQAVPQGGIQLRLSPDASGNVYVGLSGGTTMMSGGMFLSGGGRLDGMIMAPGDPYFIPRAAFGVSGTINVYVRHDAAASGQGRMFYEIF